MASTTENNLPEGQGNGRTRRPSKKALEAAEAEAAANQPTKKPPSKKSKAMKAKNVLSNNGKENVTTSTLSPTYPGEFQSKTVSSNRTNARAVNTIRLHSNVDGIPRPSKSPGGLVRIAGGQRHSGPSSQTTVRRLSPEAAANLAAMRNPFNHSGSTNSKTRGSSQVGPTSHHHAISRAPSVHPPRQSEQVGNNSVSVAPRLQRLHVAPDTPGTRTFSPPVQSQNYTQNDPKGNDCEPYINHRFVALQGISQTPLGREWGQPRTVDRSSTVLSSDDNNQFEDYAPQPRALAYAAAFNPVYDNPDAPGSIRNPYMESEEQQEIEDDPDADVEEDPANDDLYSSLNPDHDNAASLHVGSVRPREQSDAGSADDDEPASQRPRLTSPSPSDDSDADLAEPEFNSKVTPRKTALRGDYVRAAQEVLDRAVTLYKTEITSENAYPDKLTERTWAKTAWKHAARELDIPLKYHATIIPLITRYSWNLRSELKTAARHAVEGAYGFKPASPEDVEWVEYNKSRATALLTNNAFAYEDPNTDKGLYQVYIIQAVVNRVYYKGSDDDGVIHDDVYRPFPLKGLALVLTAIECAIQEWETGIFSNVNFDQNGYSRVYDKHVANLRTFEQRSRLHKLLEKIRTKISERGRAHAKAPIEHYTVTGGISEEQMDRAIAAYLTV